MLNHWLWLALCVALTIALILISFTVKALQMFSRSDLEDYCQQLSRPERFGDILKRDTTVLLALDHGRAWLLVFTVIAWTWWLLADEWLSPAFRGWIIVLGLLAWPWVVVGQPWSLARISGEWWLSRTWPFWSLSAQLLLPITWWSRQADLVAHRLLGRTFEEHYDGESIADEIRSVTEEGHREGALEANARQMIHRVIDFYDVDIADIMTPRTEMICVGSEDSLADARQVLLEEGHSRVPVIGKTPDEIVGLLYARDLLRHLDGSLGVAVTLAEIAREPFYVPETMKLDSLLQAFKKERVHIAIVLDEYGGVAGLVTLEDVLEEIVGEIADEFDSAHEGELFRTVDAHTTDVYAKLHIDDVNERLGLEIPSDGDIDTIGGFVFSIMGRLPVTGEQITWNNLEFTILEAHKRRIVRLRIRVLDDDEHDEGHNDRSS